MYAKVIVDISHEKVDRIFEYSIPESLLEAVTIGALVEIPFGVSNSVRTGYVVGLGEESIYPREKVKALLGISQGAVNLESRQIALAWWIREQYGGTMTEALRTVLPVKEKVKQQQKIKVKLLLRETEVVEKLEQYQKKHAVAKERLLKALSSVKEGEQKTLMGELALTAQVFTALEKEGVIERIEETIYRNPIEEKMPTYEKPVLNPEQQKAVERVVSHLSQEEPENYLLYGITGSGKTEVYLRIIEQVVAQGKQVIFLIPEIALTWQMVQRFAGRFGSRVSVLNSRMSKGERYDQYLRAKEGKLDVMIGPRSALFTPFANLGMIILDEEQESSYKSENTPRYHARETALQLGKMAGAPVLLGSATPSLTAYHMAKEGKLTLLLLPHRAGEGTLPKVVVTDLREEWKEGNRSILSRELKEAMEECLSKKEQMILFLNRRGYAGFVSCRSCGHVIKCPHCDISMTAHRDGTLHCHYCGTKLPMPKKCPSCGSPYIASFGLGTQKAEELIQREFPQISILRMDLDTTGGKEGYGKILSAFGEGKADVLLGTQMIVKGHDFPNVTLVGILAADLSLYGSDYQAAERTFDLLAQAAGRAGRGEKPGRVVIQTYHPEHYSIQAAAKQDYDLFYEDEFAFREALGYPPAGHMLKILFLCEKEEEAEALAGKAAKWVEERKPKATIIGPSIPGIGKLQDMYRRVIYIKALDEGILIQEKNALEQWLLEKKGIVKVQFDLDPMNG